MSIQHLQSPLTTLWRPALLALTIILSLTSLTNLVELALLAWSETEMDSLS
jgi:hypothetical protein